MCGTAEEMGHIVVGGMAVTAWRVVGHECGVAVVLESGSELGEDQPEGAKW